MWKYIKDELRPLRGQKLYLFLIIVTILRKTLFNRARAMDAYASVDANNFIAILATIVMLGIVLFQQTKIKREIRMCNTFFYYYLFAAISVVWAGFQFITIAGYKAIEVIVSYSMIILVMRNLRNITECFKFVMVSFTFCNVIYLIMGFRIMLFRF